MRRQGERPELIRWRLCGTSKTWSFVPQDENAPRPRTLLVVSELTLSLMLLIGAGLLIHSFVRLQSGPTGFTTDHVLTMEVAAAGRKYQNDKKDRKSTRLNSSHGYISYAVFCLKKKKKTELVDYI